MSSVIKQDISIGPNLKSLRLQNRLTQEDVAIRLQVMGFSMMSREIISQIERGRHNIPVSVLLTLKEIYNATFDEIFADLSFIEETHR